LIDYDSGITKQKAPTYYLLQSCNEYSNNGGNNGGNEEVKTGVLNGTFLKTRQRKRKEESSTAVAVEAEDVIEVDKVDKVEYETYSKLLQWIEKNASNVGKMKEPLTYDEFMKLKKTVDKEQLKTLLQSMHNWQPLLKKNNSAYLTIVTWSKRPHNQATKKSTGRGAQGFNGALADLENDLIARKHKLDWATSEIRRKEIMAED
jgi:hypothetical protein